MRGGVNGKKKEKGEDKKKKKKRGYRIATNGHTGHGRGVGGESKTSIAQ